MTTAHVDPRPLHQRIAADLRAEIMSGSLAPGSRMPSTVQLTDRFAASNATIQKALRILKIEGLVLGKAGSAVVVREHRQRTMRPADFVQPAEPGQTYSWIAAAEQRGLRGSSVLLAVEVVEPPDDVAKLLSIAPGGQAALRRQLLSLDDEPAELVTSYYPLSIAEGTPLMQNKRIRGGTPRLLADLGHLPRRTVDLVSARVPTQVEYEALRLPGELPVLRTLRAVYSDDDLPIEVTVMVKAGHLYELRYEF